MDYFNKMKGTTKSPPAVGVSEIFWSWVGSFIGIAAVAYYSVTLDALALKPSGFCNVRVLLVLAGCIQDIKATSMEEGCIGS